MPSRSSVLLVVSGYLLTASLGLLTWLGVRAGAPPPRWVLATGLAPVAIYLILFAAWRSRDLTHVLARSAACFGIFPILLLLWGTTIAEDVTPTPRSDDTGPQVTPEINLFRLFTGASSVRDVPMGHGGILVMRRAVFPDSSELTFYRFTNVPQAEAHLEFMQRSQRGRPVTLGDREGIRLALDSGRYVYVERHGLELVQVAAQDEAAVLARLKAQHVAPPAPAAGKGTDVQTTVAAAPTWRFAFAYALLHALALMGFWVWVQRRRDAAAAGA